ncbi:MAG: amino acid ABC transporter substrate-binding protein [Deltaproteobacteria bacterium HGW-Deltaproteobacteria-4]|nr:MAG: amino acid ABC transporter substrate-binding protein [Deltaproteobacteria bacterium HGW-Deltaproteobacteria-4]
MMLWKNKNNHYLWMHTLCALAVFFWACAALAGEEPIGVVGFSQQEALMLGEKIYRKGILPSGEPVTAIVKGDIPVDGTMFSCESCHMRSGIGSFEGGVLTTATNGANLYKAQFNFRDLTPDEIRKLPRYMLSQYLAPPRRPPYTDESLAVSLRLGIDPTGRELHSVMPRYLLDDREMKILVHYLKSLSAELSPGVTDTTIRFATIITDDVSAEEVDAAMAPLEKYILGRKKREKSIETRAKNYGIFGMTMDLSYRRISLSRWELKGSPDTWRKQLEEHYRREPVFALLGGITNGEWKPIHEFSEENRIPCIFPITDFPVISKSDWYTLYFSKGYYQEGEAVARHLGMTINLPHDKTVVQIYYNTREGRAFSSGFSETWQGLARQLPVNRILQAGEKLPPDFLRGLADKKNPPVVLLWLGPEAFPALETIAASANRPEMIYLSSSLLHENLEKLPEQSRGFTYITYPYALPRVKTLALNPSTAKGPQTTIDRRIPAKRYSTGVILTDALMMMGTDFYRDRFLEVIDMLQDKPQPYTDYERLSFGPGQRYAAKGCYIVQLTPGASPELVKKSEWVIH